MLNVVRYIVGCGRSCGLDSTRTFPTKHFEFGRGFQEESRGPAYVCSVALQGTDIRNRMP